MRICASWTFSLFKFWFVFSFCWPFYFLKREKEGVELGGWGGGEDLGGVEWGEP